MNHAAKEPKTESHDPAISQAYAAFMRTGWDDRERDVAPHPIAPWAAKRRARLAATFPGERLVLPAGTFKVRAADTDYRFRSDTAHSYFSGNQTSDAVLVVEPDGSSVLYARPRSGRTGVSLLTVGTSSFVPLPRRAGRRPTLSRDPDDPWGCIAVVGAGFSLPAPATVACPGD